MDFSTFDYNDFVTLTLSDPTLSLIDNFTVIYNSNNPTSFKLTIKPIGSITFENLIVCETTKSQGNTLL